MKDEEMKNAFMFEPGGKRRKVAELAAKYGETREDIENKCTMEEWWEYLFAGGDDMLDLVVSGKMTGRLNSTHPQTPMPTAARGKADYEVSNGRSMTEKQILDERDYWRKRGELLKRMTEHLKSPEGEGDVDNIYLDSKGHRTVGNGKMIDDKPTFMAIDFVNGGRLATRKEKEEAYDVFSNLIKQGRYGKKYGAETFEQFSPLRITKQTMEKLLEEHVQNDIRVLSHGMPEFDGLPLELQEVLVDYRYNIGSITEKNSPKLRQAIRDKNLTAILREVQRHDIHGARAKWIEERIRSIKDWGTWKN